MATAAYHVVAAHGFLNPELAFRTLLELGFFDELYEQVVSAIEPFVEIVLVARQTWMYFPAEDAYGFAASLTYNFFAASAEVLIAFFALLSMYRSIPVWDFARELVLEHKLAIRGRAVDSVLVVSGQVILQCKLSEFLQ